MWRCEKRHAICLGFSRSSPSSAWQTKAGWQALSRPSATGGGRRPAFTERATQPYSTTEVERLAAAHLLRRHVLYGIPPPTTENIAPPVFSRLRRRTSGVRRFECRRASADRD